MISCTPEPLLTSLGADGPGWPAIPHFAGVSPAGYHTLTPYLAVRDAARAITFYQEAFGATERMRLAGPEGKIAHAEVQFGDSVLMLSDEFPEWGAMSPHSLNGTAVKIFLYTDDVDALWARAAGATEKIPLANQFSGDRSGRLSDPFGHEWALAQHVEVVSEEEMMRRYEEMQSEPAQLARQPRPGDDSCCRAFPRAFTPSPPT